MGNKTGNSRKQCWLKAVLPLIIFLFRVDYIGSVSTGVNLRVFFFHFEKSNSIQHKAVAAVLGNELVTPL